MKLGVDDDGDGDDGLAGLITFARYGSEFRRSGFR